MKTLPSESPAIEKSGPVNTPTSTLPNGLLTFSVTLNNGRTVTIREMTGKDLIYMEEELAEMKDTRRSLHMMERLNVGPETISYEEIENLGIRDIRAITELVEKANGADEEEKEDPK